MKKILKAIWKELTRDRTEEIFNSGYDLGRRHQKEDDGFIIRNLEHKIRTYEILIFSHRKK